MAEGAGKTIVMLGVAGVGVYTIYEYTQYSHAINIINGADTTGKTGAAVQAALPFMSYLMAGLSAPAAGTPAGNAYQLIQSALAGTLQAAAASQTPGTSATSGQPSQTSVTTAASTSTASQAAMPQPASADLQKALNMSTATADQWNYAYHQLTGYGIEQLYGSSFDTIYGAPDSNGNRSTGLMSADAFLSLPGAKGLTRVASLKGLGAIARFYTPVVNPMSSMVYRAQHPSPYRFPVSNGMGAFTQATGFEKALWSGRFLRGNKIL